MKHLAHNISSVVNINYHIVWCPKFRRPVLEGCVGERLKELLPQIAQEMGCEIQTIEAMPDHVHIFLRGTPVVPVHLIVKSLKGRSSRLLRAEFPQLRSRVPCLWTRSYYCETIGCISEEAVRKHIENQKDK